MPIMFLLKYLGLSPPAERIDTAAIANIAPSVDRINKVVYIYRYEVLKHTIIAIRPVFANGLYH